MSAGSFREEAGSNSAPTGHDGLLKRPGAHWESTGSHQHQEAGVYLFLLGGGGLLPVHVAWTHHTERKSTSSNQNDRKSPTFPLTACWIHPWTRTLQSGWFIGLLRTCSCLLGCVGSVQTNLYLRTLTLKDPQKQFYSRLSHRPTSVQPRSWQKVSTHVYDQKQQVEVLTRVSSPLHCPQKERSSSCA